MKNINIYVYIAAAAILAACAASDGRPKASPSCEYASYFDILADSAVVAISPFDGSSDTVLVRQPLRRIICMSSTNVACLSAIGADSLVAAVSGAGYLAKLPYEGVPDIGYEAALD